MNITLERFSYGPTETEGVLSVRDYRLASIERPWIDSGAPGGKPFESCVPDGVYQIRPFTRPSGEESFILRNPSLGVYENEVPGQPGRFLILIHVGNWVTDIVGCIAVGIRRALLMNPTTGRFERAVASSAEAMKILRKELGTGTNVLEIKPRCGASQRRGEND